MKNGTEVTRNLLLNFVGSSYDETSSPYKLLLTDTQVLKIHKTLPANIKFSKTQLNDRMIQSGGILPVDWSYTTSNVSSRKRSIRKAISLAPRISWKSTKMMMMNCFCGMVDRRKAFSLISSQDHCERSSPSRISNTPRAGLEPAQNLSSGLVE